MKSISAAFALAIALFSFSAHAQTTQIGTDYLMTMHIPTERKAIDGNLVVVNILPGGWVKGPKISGKVIPPGGDWIRVMPSGVLRLDVRLTIETDDGALVYMNYGGVVVTSKEANDALARGEALDDKGIPYFIATPQSETSSDKYDWMNRLQGIAKMSKYKRTKAEAYVEYDVFAAR